MNDYIKREYKNLLRTSISITRNQERGEELLHDTILGILHQKTPPTLEPDKHFLYIYVSLKRNYYMKSSPYNKQNNTLYSELPQHLENSYDDDDSETKKLVSVEYYRILEYVKSEIKSKKIYWYNGELFILYYYPEVFYNLDIVSYRKLELEIGINFQSIRNSVKIVEDYIREHYIREE